MSDQTKAPPPASPRQVLLGLFILFQIAFLILNNFFEFAKWAPTEMKDEPKKLVNRVVPGFADDQGHVWQWVDQAETNMRRWVQLTGQDQSWALFAPTVSKSTGFPAVVLLWDDPAGDDGALPMHFVTYDPTNGFNYCCLWDRPGETPAMNGLGSLGLLAATNAWEGLAFAASQQARTEPGTKPPQLILSANEPANIRSFIRTGNCRVRRYEGQFYFNPQPYEKTVTSPAETPEVLAARISRRTKTMLNDYHDPAIKYLRWRLQAWQSANPDRAAPKQVLMVHRFYRIHGPKEDRGWDGPYTIPIARWQPDAREATRVDKLEPYDFTLNRFVNP